MRPSSSDDYPRLTQAELEWMARQEASADGLVRRGEHDKALEIYLKLFDFAHGHWRGGFLIRNLENLAKVYAPVRPALESRRDLAERAIHAGTGSSGDASVAAWLNEALGEPQRTTLLFDRASHAIRREIVLHVLDALLAARRYQDI